MKPLRHFVAVTAASLVFFVTLGNADTTDESTTDAAQSTEISVDEAAEQAVSGGRSEADIPVEPRTNNGEKWRVGYYEGGPYIDYQLNLLATVRGLMNAGWIETQDIPTQSGEETDKLWDWLVNSAKSDYIEFVADAHYSANWDDNVGKQTVDSIIARVNEKKDLDLMLAVGTMAGKGLANDLHGTPTIVMSASDPISSGIVKSAEDSGFQHVHAKVDPGRYERQLRVFHEIVGFTKLGVPYEDSVNGRSYAALDTIEALSKERGFEIVRCHTKTDIPDVNEAENTVLKCFEDFAGQVDAIYVTVQQGVTRDSLPKLVDIAHRHEIPTFSQSGSDEVRRGVLVSLSQAGFKYVGEFYAKIVAKIFNGADPNELNQLYESPPKIAINLQTAEKIGFNPPVVILGAADEIFTDIAAE